MDRRTFEVSGMSCTGCESNVETALSALSGVTRVDADHEADAVEVVAEESVTDEAIASAVREAGYDLAG